MPADQPDVTVDQQTSEPGSGTAEQLRVSKEGVPLYAEWDDSYAWSVDTNQWPAGPDADVYVAPEGGDPTNDDLDLYDPTPVSQRKEVQSQWDDFRRKVITNHLTADYLLDGVEKIYSTQEAAEFFGRSNQWMYWGLRKDPDTGLHVFTYRDGTPIQPERIGPGGRRRFKLPIIREIALSCYRRGNLNEEELQEIMAKILLAEFGERAFADT